MVTTVTSQTGMVGENTGCFRVAQGKTQQKQPWSAAGSIPQIFCVLRQVELFPTNFYASETGRLASPQLMRTPSGKAALFHLREHFLSSSLLAENARNVSLSLVLEQTLAFLHLYSLYHYDALYNVMM